MITVKPVSTKEELKQFIRFNYELYKDSPYAIPELYEDMLDTFNKKRNAALEFCEAECFMAFKDGKMVGRVAAIINSRANEKWGVKNVRFGWIDFIDDEEVSAALIKRVEEWGKAQGMTHIQGPLGFTDMDPEGMLVEGFEELGTMATIYNYPYYPRHIENLGFQKEADWVEFKVYMPQDGKVPDKHRRISEIIMRKFDLRIVKCKSKKELSARYGQALFNLINEAYEPIFGFAALTPKQIDQYVNMYLPLIDRHMISVIVDKDDQLVACGLSMPSLARPLQKAKGKLFPFGWFYLARTLFLKKYGDCLDLLLVAVKPEYQNKGVNALLFYDLMPEYQRLGFKYAETNVELEQNGKVQAQWDYFEHVQHKRRRAFIKEIR